MKKEEDYGFGFLDDETLNEESDAKAQRMMDVILPFLNALKKDPEKQIIRWENRLEIIDNLIEKLYNIRNGL